MKSVREIRPLQTEAEWDQFTLVSANAYPGVRATDDAARRRLKERAQQMHVSHRQGIRLV